MYDDIIYEYPEWMPQYARLIFNPFPSYQNNNVPLRFTKNGAKLQNNEVTKACARYANERLRALGYLIYGNAWDRMRNTSKVYSGFDAIKTARPNNVNKAKLNKYNKKAAENFKSNFNIYDAKDNDLVSLYYNNSPALADAYSEGYNGETNTHTGNIRIINDMPYVEHNIHGDLYVEPLQDLMNNNNDWGVTGIYRMPDARRLQIKLKNPVYEYLQSIKLLND